METTLEVREARGWAIGVLGGPLVLALVTLACQESTGPQWVNAVGLEPDSIFLLPGETGQFAAIPIDQHGDPLPDRAGEAEWRLDNAGVASMETTEAGVTVTAVAPGEAFVRVELGRGSGRGGVYVEPAELLEIRIEPSSIELEYRSTAVIVSAVLVGLDGNEVAADGYRVSWGSSNPEAVALLGAVEGVTKGVKVYVVGRERGQATLSLAVGDRFASTPVVVR